MFSFSFTNEDGAVNGTVSGIITLPDGDGVHAATALIVNSAPAALGYMLPFDVFTLGPSTNIFTVSGGNIDVLGSNFTATTLGGTFFSLNGSFGSLMNVLGSNTVDSGVQDGDASTTAYSPIASVPVPSTFALLLGTGLWMGLAVTARRRRIK